MKIVDDGLVELLQVLSVLKADSKYKTSIQSLYEEVESLRKKAALSNELILNLLKSKIGQPIYWADKAWRKYEKHIISDVRYEIQESGFFGDEYAGKKCVKIYVDGDGYYLANEIGKTIFFSETEAESHTQQ